MNWPIFRLNEEHFTFHLQYKHSGTFANHKYGELSYPKNSETVRPHYSQSSRENGTPSCGTSPLASYKEVLFPPPPPSPSRSQAQNSNTANAKGVMSFEDKLEGLKLLTTENEESNPKNNSQLYNSNFIRSKIKLYKHMLFNKCNQIIDKWN